MRTILKRDPNKPGPLESYKMAGHCEMCGANDFQPHPELEPAFNPSGQPKTLCRDCRIGSAELLADQRADLLEAATDLLAARDKTNESLRAKLQRAIDKATDGKA
jgi:hypothetical protein